MIQETTTKTIEVMKVDNQLFTITTVEQKTTGFCDICGDQESGSRQGLINKGWQLNSQWQLCPTCNL